MFLNIFHKTDIFVLPSFREGFPVSLIEAQMSGCLTIASDVGANHELIINNQTGYIFEPGNHNELGSILLNVTLNWNDIITVIKNGQKNSLKYCSSLMIKSYINLYRDVPF